MSKLPKYPGTMISVSSCQLWAFLLILGNDWNLSFWDDSLLEEENLMLIPENDNQLYIR